MNKGALIVFCGIDGSGKSTQANMLIKSLKQDGLEVSYVYNRWNQLYIRLIRDIWKKSIAKNVVKPDSNFYSIKKSERRKLLSNPVFRRLWLTYFFVVYGCQLFVKIRMGLLKRQLIVSDRIFYDSVIDQAVDLGYRKDHLLASLDSSWIKIFFPVPDLVIYCDCPEEIAFSRKNDIPDIDYLLERRELYLKLANKYSWFKVDGTLSVDEIALEIKNKVYSKLRVCTHKFIGRGKK